MQMLLFFFKSVKSFLAEFNFLKRIKIFLIRNHSSRTIKKSFASNNILNYKFISKNVGFEQSDKPSIE